MAEFKPGVLGVVSGKVGTVIASNWRDIYYLKGLPFFKKKKDGSSINCIRLARIHTFIRAVSPLAEEGFKHRYAGRSSPFHLAIKANMRAFKGKTAEIDFQSVVISAGSLAGAVEAEGSFISPEKMLIRWADLGDTNNQAPSDLANIVFYNASKEQAVTSAGNASRGGLEAEIELPKSYAGDELHGYIYFTNAANSRNSESFYLGCFRWPEPLKEQE